MHQIQAHPSLTSLFAVPHLSFVVDAMQAGSSPARIWVDDLDAPRSAFIWDTTHCLYAGGDASNPAFTDWLRGFIADTYLPTLEREQLGGFKLTLASPDWEDPLRAVFQPLELAKYPRVCYRLNPARIPPVPELPPGYSLRPITRDLLTAADDPGVADLIEEIELCWPTRDRFFERGFGWVLYSDADGIVCRCTAEYASPGQIGVGIATRESHQGRGFATATARQFAQHAAQLGLRTHWDAWTRNVPSWRVAEKAGFEKISDYDVLFWWGE